MKRRVVVTGVSAITPIGIGKDEFWKNLTAGKSGIGRITLFDPSRLNCQIAGEVKDFDFGQYGDKKEAKRMDRVTQFAVACGNMAFADSGLKLEDENPKRIGVCVGSGIGGMQTFVDVAMKYAEKGPSRISPFFIPMEIPNMPAAQIAIALGLKGPNTAIVTACATGTNCIGDALRTIQYGDADVMLAGGSEAAITEMAIAGFDNMKALSRNNEEPEKASCPFDKKRSGFVMGEGAGVIVLEELEHAKKRGAHIYAEVIGYGYNSDAYHITAPDPSGEMPAECMLAAISDGGITPDDVSYVNAHGTSTHRNDLNETLACKKIFGDRAKQVPISSNKSMTGHLLGAAGGMEAVASVLTIETGIIPPTINYEDPDTEDEMDLDYVPNVARKADVDVVLSNNFGFGGHNACVTFRKYKD